MLREHVDVTREAVVAEVVAEFLDDCRMRNLSPNTMRWYSDNLSRLFAEVWDEDFGSLNVRHVREKLASLLETRSASTVNGYLRSAKALLNFAIDNDIEIPFIPRKLKKLREPKKIPPCFTPEQLDADSQTTGSDDVLRLAGLHDDLVAHRRGAPVE